MALRAGKEGARAGRGLPLGLSEGATKAVRGADAPCIPPPADFRSFPSFCQPQIQDRFRLHALCVMVLCAVIHIVCFAMTVSR